MTQTILDKNSIKIETEVERLERIRLQYYIELLQEIDRLRDKRIELIKNYKIEMYNLDKKIVLEKYREKHNH